MRTALFLSIVSGLAVALPAQDDLVEKRGSNNAGPDPSLATKVSFKGDTFINKVRVLPVYMHTTWVTSYRIP